LNPGIQVADWFAYVVRLNHEYELWRAPPRQLVRDEYLLTISRYARIIRSKTVDFERADGSVHYGIATMDASKFEYEPSVEESMDAEAIFAELGGGIPG
jgi:hypothetical protein